MTSPRTIEKESVIVPKDVLIERVEQLPPVTRLPGEKLEPGTTLNVSGPGIVAQQVVVTSPTLRAVVQNMGSTSGASVREALR